MIMWACCW